MVASDELHVHFPALPGLHVDDGPGALAGADPAAFAVVVIEDEIAPNPAQYPVGTIGDAAVTVVADAAAQAALGLLDALEALPDFLAATDRDIAKQAQRAVGREVRFGEHEGFYLINRMAGQMGQVYELNPLLASFAPGVIVLFAGFLMVRRL